MDVNYSCIFVFLLLLSDGFADENVFVDKPSSSRGKTDKVEIKSSHFLKLLSFVKAAIQWLRRMIKRLRGWYKSHPSELKLGKCFVSYFDIKIPGLSRRSDEFVDEKDYIDTPGRTLTLESRYLVLPELEQIHEVITAIKTKSRWTKHLIRTVSNAVDAFFLKIRTHIMSYKLIACTCDYLSTKFWKWIDAAPDPKKT